MTSAEGGRIRSLWQLFGPFRGGFMDGRCQHVRMGLYVGYGNIGRWKFVSNTAIIIICLRTDSSRFHLHLVQSMTRALPCCSDRQSHAVLSSRVVDQYLFKKNEIMYNINSKLVGVRRWIDQVFMLWKPHHGTLDTIGAARRAMQRELSRQMSRQK
ncbi:hypothetical protein J3458_002787 [Metarhizium acridum]|uniref:uncharacterized protein n=1 Tax=Metarhizium acridum TaxID=92637 RepID=UPI001C6CAFF4|nr:hypothetical protein J3458_002787 [Metarhizium acridum]